MTKDKTGGTPPTEDEIFDEIAENRSKDIPEALSAAERRDRKNDAKAARALKKLVDDEDDNESINISLRTILGGDILGGRWFRRNFWYLVLIAGMLVFYVSNRYYCQQEMIEGTRLRDTLQDRRYKALTLSGQLKELTRRSEIESQLADTTLKTATTTIYSLTVEADDTVAAN